MRILLSICFTLILGGCVSANSSSSPSWSQLKMNGLILELKDPVVIEQYFFGKNGVVGATLGEINGPLVAPVFFWKTKKDILSMVDEDGKPVERWRLIEINPASLVVLNATGTRIIYGIKRK